MDPNESLLSLAEAAKFLPKKPNGKRINIRTIERWIRGGNGARIKLDGLLIGSTLMTSKEALIRFGRASLQAEEQIQQSAKPLKSDPRAVAVLVSRGILKDPNKPSTRPESIAFLQSIGMNRKSTPMPEVNDGK